MLAISKIIDKSKAKKKQTIKGSYDNEYIIGSKNADTIYGNGGLDIIVGGKGNDKIYVKGVDSTESTIICVGKGDGNDTIYIDKENPTDINLFINKSPDFGFKKNNNDLVITLTYAKEGKEKKNTVQTLTLKNYYSDGIYGPGGMPNCNVTLNYTDLDSFAGKSYEQIIASYCYQVPLEGMIQSYETIINAKAKKNNFINGSYGNDVIYGGNKNDIIVEYSGNNTVFSGKKGATFVMSRHNGYSLPPFSLEEDPTVVEGGNDKYVISSINNKTLIYDFGGKDTLQINGAKTDDTYLYFDMTSDGDILGTTLLNDGQKTVTPWSTEALYFMNGSEISNSIKKNLTSVAGDMNSEKRTVKLNIGGVGLLNYFETGTNDVSSLSAEEKAQYGIDSDATSVTVYPGNMESVYFADSKGKNAKLVSSENIGYAIEVLKGNVIRYLNDIDQYSTQGVMEIANSVLSIKTNKKMSKAEKASISESKKMAKIILDDMAKVYKSVKLGTDGDDVYSNIKRDTYSSFTYESDGMVKESHGITKTIFSGKGNDTFKFAKDFGNVNIYADSNKIGLNPVETDKLIFKNHAFEDGSLGIFVSDTVPNPEKGPNIIIGEYLDYFSMEYGYMPDNLVTYNGFFNANAPLQDKNLVIQDKYRTYDVNLLSSAFLGTENLSADLSNSSKNRILFTYGNAEISAGKGYNVINNMMSMPGEIHTITYNGGHDLYQMVGSNDNYIVNFDKNTSLCINDLGGNDMLKLNGNAMDMRIFFNLGIERDEDGNIIDIYYGDDLKILDKNVFTANNLKKDYSNSVGVNISSYFEFYDNEQKIESFVFEDKFSGYTDSFDMDNWISSIQSEVAGWLGDHGYEATNEVFAKNNKADVNALIAIYRNSDIQNAFI